MFLQSFVIAAAIVAFLLEVNIARSQDFPNKPVRMVAGERGVGDFAARQTGSILKS